MGTACTRTGPKDVVVAIHRDSLGVQLVDFPRLPRAQGILRLANRSEVVLGGIQDNDSLEFDARGYNLTATALADGQLVVADHQRLKFYSARGILTRIVGRGGYGPGEFSSARDVCAQPDSTLIVVDEDGRWSHWGPDGALRRAQSREGFVPRHGCSSQGTIMVRVPSSEGAYSLNTRLTLPYVLYALDGQIVRPLGRLAAPEYFAQLFFEPSFALLGDGLLVAEPQRFEVRVQSLATGLVTKRWRVLGAERPLTNAAWDSLVESTFPSNATAEQRRKKLARLAALGKPPAYPAFWKVLVDPRGRIWINPYFDHMHWYVINGNGASMSLVALPVSEAARPQLVDFAGDLAVIRHVDDEGAAVLSFFRITESAP